MAELDKYHVMQAIATVVGAGLVDLPSYIRERGSEGMYTVMLERHKVGGNVHGEGLRRGKGIAELRGTVAAFLWRNSDFSNPEIAEAVGYRSHTPVIDARRKYAEKIERISFKKNKIESKPEPIKVILEEVPPFEKTGPLFDDGDEEGTYRTTFK